MKCLKSGFIRPDLSVFVFLLFIPIVPTACQDGHPLETEDDTGI
jgi:hypothetical protein